MHTKDIQVIYEKHRLLDAKGKGAAGALVGKTAVLLFFVNDPQSKWNDSAQKKFSKTHSSAMETVIKEAKKHAVSLTIDTLVQEVTVPFICETNLKASDPDKWDKYIIDQYNRKVFRGYKYHFKETLGYDQVALVFAFNREFRAHATSNSTYAAFDAEHSVLSFSDSEHTIIHELFHQFGAADLYYPDDVVKAVRKYDYHSIMGYGKGIHIDSLTAYLIGWSEEIDETTVALLEDTKHLRLKDIILGRRKA